MNITEQICVEVQTIRDAYIKAYVNRCIGRHNGNVTNEQVEQWETDSADRWDLYYPALAKLVSS